MFSANAGMKAIFDAYKAIRCRPNIVRMAT
jgi:hypothetical protein